MKNKKLSLHNLRVTSFVTSLEKNGQDTLKGGADAAVTPGCGPSFQACPTIPIDNCNIPSYDPCITIPVEQCNVNPNLSKVRILCENIYITNTPELGC
jgi:hypothetical protein